MATCLPGAGPVPEQTKSGAMLGTDSPSLIITTGFQTKPPTAASDWWVKVMWLGPSCKGSWERDLLAFPLGSLGFLRGTFLNLAGVFTRSGTLRSPHPPTRIHPTPPISTGFFPGP